MSQRFRVSDLGEEPLVSVIIPSYNHAAYVADAVQSILGQTYQHVELLVVDDGSTDESWSLLQQLHRHRSDKTRIRIFRHDNKGVCATLNFGVRWSSGDLICILASDDWFRSDKIARQVAFFKASPEETGLIHSAAYKVYPSGRLVTTHGQYKPAQGSCLKDVVAVSAQIIACSIMFPKRVWEEVGGFDETLQTEDIPFFAAVCALGYEIRYDPEPLLYKREGPAGLGGNTKACSTTHFRTLERYRTAFSREELVEVTAHLQAGEGSLWSAQLRFRQAWGCYVAAARTRGSPLPIMSFAVRALRDTARFATPEWALALLRGIRARAATHNLRD